jgi:AcrR family transcriptional regulator
LPTPAKTSRAELVGIALRLVAKGGAEAITIAAVAKAAGVKGPSLYKHFVDREALLTATEIAVLHQLEAQLRARTAGRTPKQRLKSMAHVYRAFGKSAPQRYGMIYRKAVTNEQELIEACLFSAKPLFEALAAAGAPAKQIQPLSRTLVAFLHGFVTMEINEVFRLGGNLDDDFEAALTTILQDV